jgi:hypothetical protein
MLSAAVAAVSLVLLLALLVPAQRGLAPQAASPLPSARIGPLTILSGPTAAELGVNVKLVSGCADGIRIVPPYYLVFEGNGRVMAVPLDGGASGETNFVARAPDVYIGSGLTVSCPRPTSPRAIEDLPSRP